MITTSDVRSRPRAEGKFLWVDDEKLFVRGVTYGAFPPNAQGHQFPEPTVLTKDFALMASAGINTILTYTVPPPTVLDHAQENGLRVILHELYQVAKQEDAEGLDPIDLDRFLRGLDDPDALPERSALVTFDDGYRSMRDTTLPWLRRFDTPGVLFVPTDYVGGHNDFDRGVEPEEAICDWDDLRALHDAGVAIQSHAGSHRSFSALDRAEREQELGRSKTLLEERLGAPVATIAFPYGDPGPDADRDQPAGAGYRTAFTYRGSPVRLPVADRFRIERIAVGQNTDLRAELEKLS